ncbi:MAG: hypothetical protein JKY02_06830 [Flavobacteriaceae bacterium]|nr:hypothetical protein [Flavobacteriaceae bacterium]
MTLKNLLPCLVFGILFASCKKENTLQDYMADSWQTTYLKIEMPTFQKSDSINVFEDKFENNPARIAQSSYNEDGTFVAWFLDKERKRQGDSSGKWNVKGDSLYVAFFYGGRDVKVAYHIQMTEGGFIGTCIYDWDEDGEFDDLLVMKTKRINLEN